MVLVDELREAHFGGARAQCLPRPRHRPGHCSRIRSGVGPDDACPRGDRDRGDAFRLHAEGPDAGFGGRLDTRPGAQRAYRGGGDGGSRARPTAASPPANPGTDPTLGTLRDSARRERARGARDPGGGAARRSRHLGSNAPPVRHPPAPLEANRTAGGLVSGQPRLLRPGVGTLA